jgi:hypothetical protein
MITSRAGRQILKARKHSPVILFTVGTVGMVATVVLACRATLKMHDILDEHEEEIQAANKIHDSLDKYSDDENKKDLVRINVSTALRIAQAYAPAVGIGLLSIGALTGSHIVLNRRYIGMTAAYAAMHKGFDEYRKRVVDQYGKEVDEHLRYGVQLKEIVEEGSTGPEIKVVKRAAVGSHGSIYAKWFDAGSRNFQREPQYNVYFLGAQQRFLNEKLQAQGHLFLNEVYDALDLPRTQEGAVVGWLKDSHLKLGSDGKPMGDGALTFADDVLYGESQEAREFFNGVNKAILLDFNVDGPIWNLI